MRTVKIVLRYIFNTRIKGEGRKSKFKMILILYIMSDNQDKTIDFEKKLKEKLARELKRGIDNNDYDEIINYILNAYSEGLNIFYEEGVKSFFEEFAKKNDKNLRTIIGIIDSQRETITNLNKKIQNQENRIAKLEEEIKLILKESE